MWGYGVLLCNGKDIWWICYLVKKIKEKKMFKMQKLLFIPLISVVSFINPHILLLTYLLFGSTLIDFVTGITASWIEKNDSKEHNKKYFIENHKLRKSLTKVMSYLFLIIVTHYFAIIFGINELTIPILNIKTTLITIAFSICISIEVYSVIENLNRIGFDLFGEIKKVIQGIIKIVKFLTNSKKKIEDMIESSDDSEDEDNKTEKVEGEL